MMLKRLLVWLGWSYAVLMIVWLLARSLVLGHLWWVSILNYIAVYLFIPLPVLLLFALVLHRWRLVAGLGIPLAAFLSFYGPLFLPSWTQPVASEPAITVMTFNLRLGNRDYPPLVEIIRAVEADIVGIQEFVPGLMAPMLDELSTDYPYSAVVTDQPEAGVVGILSKFAIADSTSFPLPGKPSGINLETSEEFSLAGPRFGIQATVLVDDEPLQVVSIDAVHNPTLGKPLTQWPSVAREHYTQKMEEIRLLEQRLAESSDPFLILCDCNLADTSEFHYGLSRFAIDSFRAKGWGFGHTLPVAIGPLSVPAGQRMDYIWHSRSLPISMVRVGPDAGSSDHFPVLAKLVLSR
ncbi:MAG: endonuclease/exonuclease/phosphatase family protein [Cyanobacteria bacterium J06626_18]